MISATHIEEIKKNCLGFPRHRNSKALACEHVEFLLSHPDVTRSDLYEMHTRSGVREVKKRIEDYLLSRSHLPVEKIVFLVKRPSSKEAGLTIFEKLCRHPKVSVDKIRQVSKLSTVKMVRVRAQEVLLGHPEFNQQDKDYLSRRGDTPDVKMLARNAQAHHLH